MGIILLVGVFVVGAVLRQQHRFKQNHTSSMSTFPSPFLSNKYRSRFARAGTKDKIATTTHAVRTSSKGDMWLSLACRIVSALFPGHRRSKILPTKLCWVVLVVFVVLNVGSMLGG